MPASLRQRWIDAATSVRGETHAGTHARSEEDLRPPLRPERRPFGRPSFGSFGAAPNRALTDGSVDWFLLPGKVGNSTPPILVGGDQIVQFRHAPDVDALIAYLAGPTAGRSWVREGGFLSPKSSIPADVYPNDFLGELDRVLKTARTLAFDASDQMPPDVGSGLLWRDVTAWVAGVEDYAALADQVDRALVAAGDGSQRSP